MVTVTEKTLRSAEAAYRAAYARAEQLRSRRNAAVRAAIDVKMTHAEIARATGLTRTRVGQIAQSSRPASS
jgi:hypothetical protein